MLFALQARRARFRRLNLAGSQGPRRGRQAIEIVEDADCRAADDLEGIVGRREARRHAGLQRDRGELGHAQYGVGASQQLVSDLGVNEAVAAGDAARLRGLDQDPSDADVTDVVFAGH